MKTNNYSPQFDVKKDNSDSPNENYLETQSLAGEENKSGHMPVYADNQHPADNSLSERIKLNHKCFYCEKDIFLGERVILNPRPFHLDCAVARLKEESDKSIRKGAERYGICEFCADRFNDIINKIFGDMPEENRLTYNKDFCGDGK